MRPAVSQPKKVTAAKATRVNKVMIGSAIDFELFGCSVTLLRQSTEVEKLPANRRLAGYSKPPTNFVIVCIGLFPRLQNGPRVYGSGRPIGTATQKRP